MNNSDFGSSLQIPIQFAIRFSEKNVKHKFAIEDDNIEYGNIEKCNIDSVLTSKNQWRVSSKKIGGNIEFIIEKFKFENDVRNYGKK